jgi:hypothetical protein
MSINLARRKDYQRMPVKTKNGELWNTVRQFAEGRKVTPAVRDKFLFAAMDDLRNRIANIEEVVEQNSTARRWVDTTSKIFIGVFITFLSALATGVIRIVR